MINEYFVATRVTASEMDLLWAEGWRHFGTYFFRYSTAEHEGARCHVLPLRLKLSAFEPSRSQKRVLKRNQDIQIVIRDPLIDTAKVALFERHRKRFKQNVPDSLHDFMSERPATVPCRCQEICVYDGGRLLAVSFLDIGEAATSAVYAAFDPSESQRSLGILTMLYAIGQSRALGCLYYYPGYAYREPSFYDYKKRFAGLEGLDWEGGWSAL
jgi:arginyl-tRNA--protein-N-Asp/Glu arginylyltransferase